MEWVPFLSITIPFIAGVVVGWIVRTAYDGETYDK